MTVNTLIFTYCFYFVSITAEDLFLVTSFVVFDNLFMMTSMDTLTVEEKSALVSKI